MFPCCGESPLIRHSLVSGQFMGGGSRCIHEYFVRPRSIIVSGVA